MIPAGPTDPTNFDFGKMIAQQEAAGYIVTGFKINSETMKRLKARLVDLGILIEDTQDAPIEMLQGLPLHIDDELGDYEVALITILDPGRMFRDSKVADILFRSFQGTHKWPPSDTVWTDPGA